MLRLQYSAVSPSMQHMLDGRYHGLDAFTTALQQNTRQSSAMHGIHCKSSHCDDSALQILLRALIARDRIVGTQHRRPHCEYSAQGVVLSGYKSYKTSNHNSTQRQQYCNVAMAIKHWTGNDPGHHAKKSHCQGLCS